MNPQGICYTTPGNYDVTLIATGTTGTDTLTMSAYITVFPFPSPQGIFQNGDTLFANQGALTYQWYYNGTIIPGATEYYYVAPAAGNYNVVATDVNGCEVEAVIFDVVASTGALTFGEGSGVKLFPNPVTDNLFVTLNNGIKIVSMTVLGRLGEKVISSHDQNGVIDCRGLLHGIYLLEIVTVEKIYHVKFLMD
jgi:PKD repeat protein